MFKRLAAALLAGPLLVGLIPTAASAVPAEAAAPAAPAVTSSDHRTDSHYRCMYRCEERFGRGSARHDDRDSWRRDRDRDRRDRDRYDRRKYDRRRYDRCRNDRCERIYHNGRCWYHDGESWRRCRSRDRYRYRSSLPLRPAAVSTADGVAPRYGLDSVGHDVLDHGQGDEDDHDHDGDGRPDHDPDEHDDDTDDSAGSPDDD